MKTKKNIKNTREDTQVGQRNYKNFRDISEYFSNAITEVSKIDKDNNMISGVCAFRPVSENNRIYKEKAVKSLVKLMPNIKAFRNHGGMFSSSGVEDLLGEHVNVRRHNGGIFTDLSILETARYKDMIFDIAENKPHLAGFSINARGKFADDLDEDGREVVEDIVSLRSVDFVGDPATTFGVFEDKRKQLEVALDTKTEHTNKDGGDFYMKKLIAYLEGKIRMAGLTEDGVDSAVLEYVKKLEDAQESLTTSVKELTESGKANEEGCLAANKELEKIREAYKTVEAKLTSFEDDKKADADRKERVKLIDVVLETEKFPKEKISKAFMRILLEIKATAEETAEARIKDLVIDRAGTLKPDDTLDESSGDEQKEEKKEGEESKGEKDHATKVKEAREQLKDAVGNRAW